MLNPFAYGARITDPTRFVGRAILRKLTWRDVIEKTDGGYRLASPIVGKWVRERAL